MAKAKPKAGGMTPAVRKQLSQSYYMSLMSGFSKKKAPTPKAGAKKEQGMLYTMHRIGEEVNILGQQGKMTEKSGYNKYYWNLIALSEALKQFPEHEKSGNFAHDMSNQDIVKHFAKGKKMCQTIISKMEMYYQQHYQKRKSFIDKKKKAQKGGKGGMVSFRDFIRPTGGETADSGMNQFSSFVQSNYGYKVWAQQNKKSRLLKEDKKWLKTLRGGGMEEVFKQKICEQHFLKVFNIPDYPIQTFLATFVDHCQKSLQEMEKGMFCNVDKLIRDVMALKDVLSDVVMEGYRTQLKGLEKHNFPLGVMRKHLFGCVIKGIKDVLIPLFAKFHNLENDKRADRLRMYLLLDRLPIDEALKLPNDPFPYRVAIEKLSTLATVDEIPDMLRVFEDAYHLVFKCIDEYYDKHDKSKVGMKIVDTDLSMLLLYVMLNADVASIHSWVEFVREFRAKSQKAEIFNLFDFILKWTKDIEIETEAYKEEKKKKKYYEEEEKSARPVIPMRKKKPAAPKAKPSKKPDKPETKADIERSIEEKNMMINMLERKVFDKMQSVRKKLGLTELDESMFL